jgi:hypothetical protein
VVAAGLAACGLDENGLLQVPVGDDSGVSPEAGDDGTTGSGSGGSSGQDGSGTDDGGSSTGSGSGSGGGDSSGSPPDASPAPLAYDGGALADPDLGDLDWIDFCVGVTGCFPAGSVSGCLGHMRQPGDTGALFPTPDMLSCVKNAGHDCTAIAACIGAGGPCNPQSSHDSCNGNLWMTCQYGGELAIDCSTLGLVCSLGANNAGCGFGDCYAWQQGDRYCAGQYVVECNKGRYEPYRDCQTFGLACGGSPGQCQGDTSTCNSVNCAQLTGYGSFQCSIGPGGTPICTAGNQCNALQQDTCDPSGHVVRFCNAGVPSTVDCHAAGWNNDCQGGVCTNQ